MCGIAGIVEKTGGGLDREALVAMRDAQAHRGPDDAGLWVDPAGCVGLAHRRLSIIDLSPAGRQPMANEDGRVQVVYNGEIYNFAELRRELETGGHRFRSRTDSEVIVHGWEEWGRRCVERFRGMFAFALWDEGTRTLFLARDRLGVKPLFVYEDEKRLLFASEIKGILAHPEASREPDPSAIWDYLTYFYVPTPKSAYKRIRKLPPGHTFVLDERGGREERYWDVDFASTRPIGRADAAQAVRAKIEEAVRIRLVADTPLGAFLSGGVDSTAITAMMAAACAPEPVRTFSIGFDVKEHDEREWARIAARRYETRHEEEEIGRDAAESMYGEVNRLYDEPFGDGSALPTYFVSRLARRKVTVALSGDGGDEVFGGYHWYARWLELQLFGRVPLAGSPGLAGRLYGSLPIVRRNRPLYGRMGGQRLSGVEQYAKLLGGWLGEEKRRLVRPEFARHFRDYDDCWHFARHWREDLDPLSRLQYLDLKTYLPDDILAKVDRASMAVALEVRVPLLDHELVELVARIPRRVRNPWMRRKHVLKSAVRGLVPGEILARKKRGFSAPFYAWLGRTAREARLGMIEQSLRGGASVLGDDVLGAIRSLDVRGHKLWRLVVLGQWLDSNAPSGVGAP